MYFLIYVHCNSKMALLLMYLWITDVIQLSTATTASLIFQPTPCHLTALSPQVSTREPEGRTSSTEGETKAAGVG